MQHKWLSDKSSTGKALQRAGILGGTTTNINKQSIAASAAGAAAGGGLRASTNKNSTFVTQPPGPVSIPMATQCVSEDLDDDHASLRILVANLAQ